MAQRGPNAVHAGLPCQKPEFSATPKIPGFVTRRVASIRRNESYGMARFNRHPPDGRRLQPKSAPVSGDAQPASAAGAAASSSADGAEAAEAKLNAESAKSSSIKTHVSRCC
jgi:hypothetical protein